MKRENFIVNLTLLAPAIASILTYFLKVFNQIPEGKALLANIIIVCGLLVFIINYIIRGIIQFRKAGDSPPPEFLWGFLLNALPISKSVNIYNDLMTYNIIVLHADEDESNKISHELDLKTLNESSVHFKFIFIKIKNESSSNWKNELTLIDCENFFGAVIITSKNLEENKAALGIIDKWMTVNSHMPCFMIDTVPNNERVKNAYNANEFIYKYERIILDEKNGIETFIDKLILLLLSRANNRGFLWQKQSGVNRKIALYLFLPLILLLSCTAVYLSIQKKSIQFENIIELKKIKKII